MASPMRLNADLIAAAERESRFQRRSVPKQIEFWASLGRAVQQVVDHADIVAVLQGLKKITVEPLASTPVAVDEVFDRLEDRRQSGEMAKSVTDAAVYYEASRRHPGLIDRVHAATGRREAGQFENGRFQAAG